MSKHKARLSDDGRAVKKLKQQYQSYQAHNPGFKASRLRHKSRYEMMTGDVKTPEGYIITPSGVFIVADNLINNIEELDCGQVGARWHYIRND